MTNALYTDETHHKLLIAGIIQGMGIILLSYNTSLFSNRFDRPRYNKPRSIHITKFSVCQKQRSIKVCCGCLLTHIVHVKE